MERQAGETGTVLVLNKIYEGKRKEKSTEAPERMICTYYQLVRSILDTDPRRQF